MLLLGLGGGLARTIAVPAGDQVDRGREIYQARCALCHGDKGEGRLGRPLIGPDAGLGGFGTAMGLFDYVRKVMPADAPGRLLESEYWAVLAFILKENDLLPPETTLGRDSAAAVPLSP